MNIPNVPQLHIAFVLMILGIIYGTYSRNVPAKRVVLIVVVLLFAYISLETIRRTFDPPTWVLLAIGLFMAHSAGRAARQVRFCKKCGRTIQDKSRRTTCQECRKSSSSPAPASAQ